MMNPLLITCYKDPDLDGYACVVGYTELARKTGSTADPWISGRIHPEAQFVAKKFGFHYPEAVANPEKYEKIVLLDSSDIRGLDSRINPQKVVEIIDHRKINDAHTFPNANVQIELVGSAATLVTEKFREKSIVPSAESAVLLYSAIASNTLNFKANVTTERDKEAAKWLMNNYVLPTNYVHEMFLAKSDLSGEKLKEGIEGDFAWFTLGDKKIGIAQLEVIDAEKLAAERKNEITQELERINGKKKLDFTFMSIIELEKGFNLFISSNSEAQKILSDLFHISFNDEIAKRNGLIMRKEIVPLLKQKIETDP